VAPQGRRPGGAEDDSEAVRWFRKAADARHAAAPFNLGVRYQEGRGVAQDEPRGRRVVPQGRRREAHRRPGFGEMYRHGRGVAKDEAEAVRWFRKAADQGDARGQQLLTKPSFWRRLFGG